MYITGPGMGLSRRARQDRTVTRAPREAGDPEMVLGVQRHVAGETVGFDGFDRAEQFTERERTLQACG